MTMLKCSCHAEVENIWLSADKMEVESGPGFLFGSIGIVLEGGKSSNLENSFEEANFSSEPHLYL